MELLKSKKTMLFLTLFVYGKKKATRGIIRRSRAGGGGVNIQIGPKFRVEGPVNIRFPFDNLELSVQKRSEMGLWPETLLWTRFWTPKMGL